MKLVLLFLFAVCFCSLGNTTTNRGVLVQKKLEEVLRQVNDVKESLEMMVNSPPQNIEDCCCLSALKCFQANLQVHFNITERKQSKLNKSLRHRLTESGLNFCNSGMTVLFSLQSTCQDCTSHPKVNVNEFLNRLESLIQRSRITEASLENNRQKTENYPIEMKLK
uniref:Uncharacterized protein n=1 Tax=Mastacembelus armatus TaxID=205130 RepID=A0A3Q3M6J7_9TELE